jgi:hypothetical protein
MKKEKITHSCGNIFKDIGCKNPEKLLKEADIKIDQMKKEYNYTWSDFDVAVKIIKDTASIDFLTWSKFKTILGVGKGGLILAIKLSNIFDLPLKIVMTNSYKDKKKESLVIQDFNPWNTKDPVLLVDDIVDSGETLKSIKDILEVWNKKVITLVLCAKPHSIIKPDYSYLNIDNDFWVNFPWE